MVLLPWMTLNMSRKSIFKMKKMVVLLCCCLALGLGGCDPAPSQEAPQTNAKEPPILIGLIPEHNIFKQLERYEPLAEYLGQKIGRKIELKVLTRYGNIVDNFVANGLDAAFLGSFTYTLAHAKLGVRIIARPVNNDGVSSYHGLIFVRKDSGIKGIKEMRGKVFAFVDKATTAGYILPLGYFKENGIEDYKSYFKETYFTGTHEDAIKDVIDGKADVGAAKNTVFERMIAEERRVAENLTVLEKSPDVPENGLAVSRTMDPTLAENIKSVLLTMHNDPKGLITLKKFGINGFIETTDQDYAAIYKYSQEIGLNLKTYDYINQ